MDVITYPGSFSSEPMSVKVKGAPDPLVYFTSDFDVFFRFVTDLIIQGGGVCENCSLRIIHGLLCHVKMPKNDRFVE